MLRKPLRVLSNCLFFLSSPFLKAEEPQSPQSPVFHPWFTGPLLAPSAFTVKPKHANLEPYLTYTMSSFSYDERGKRVKQPSFGSYNLQIETKFGILPFLDFQCYPQLFYNSSQGSHHFGLGDLPLGLNVQLYRPFKPQDPFPAVKLVLQANTPLGKYQKLNPHLHDTDALGAGSWLPTVGIAFSKLFSLYATHYLETRFYMNYQIGTKVHVKGLNSYGGTLATKGIIYPGNSFTCDLAFEYDLTQNWALALDLYYENIKKNRFIGSYGQQNPPVFLNSYEWSAAPAIEYNWSNRFGLIGGSWFSFKGKNIRAFTSYLLAFNAYF